MYSKVKDILKTNPFKLYDDDRIETAIEIFVSMNSEASLIFNNEEQFIGVVTEKELLAGSAKGCKKLNEIFYIPEKSIYEDDSIDSVIKINQSIYPVMNTSEEIVGLLTRKELLENYSEQVNLELSQYDAIFSSAHNGILSIDDKGFITSINPAAEKLAGVPREEAIGHFVSDVVTPRGLLNIIRTGEATSEKYKVGNRHYITNRTPIVREGKVIGAVGVFQDISEIEFVSNELNSVKKLLNEQKTILESVTDGVLKLDRYGKIIEANHAFLNMMDLTESPSYYQELLSNHLNYNIFSEVNEKNERVSIMEFNKQNNNQLMITGTPVKNNSMEEYRIVVTVRDISEIDKLRKELEHTKQHLNNLMERKRSETQFIAHSPKMRKLVKEIEQTSKVDSTILIYGESGVGKEAVVNYIHDESPRKEHPLIKVNCSAIAETLMEQELFGYEKEVDGHKEVKVGYFEKAHKGTIMLDDIEALPLTIQVKLLRVLQENEIVRVGSNTPVPLDVRVIGTTVKNLISQVNNQTFRKDLYYLLHVIPITIPPLRERVQDIPLLTTLFHEQFVEKYNLNKPITDKAITTLSNYYWPGNVRQLINIIERLIVTTRGSVIEESQVRKLLNDQQENYEQGLVYVNGILPLREAVEEVEKQLLTKAMNLYNNTRKSAKVLNINQSTVVRKLSKHSIESDFNMGDKEGVKAYEQN